jgi:hypothetical protein
MSLLDQAGRPIPEIAAPPNWEDWPSERRQALYELAGNWSTMTRLAKWTTALVMFLGAVAAVIYYTVNILHTVEKGS